MATEHATALPRPQAAPSPGSLPLAPPPGCAASSSHCQSSAMQYVRLRLSMQLAWPPAEHLSKPTEARGRATPRLCILNPSSLRARCPLALQPDRLWKSACYGATWVRGAHSRGRPDLGAHHAQRGNKRSTCDNASACGRIPIRAF